MSGSQNIETIKNVYAAFGRGDADAILAVVTDDVDWGSEAAPSKVTPWHGLRKGKKEVGAFFDDIGKSTEVEEFTPLTFGSNADGDVFTIVRYTARSRETGKNATMQLHHWFRFTNGKISYYRGSEDTASMASAFTR